MVDLIKQLNFGKYSIKVPKKCLYCGSEWIGGHEIPNKLMKPGLRVFYKCGASLSIRESNDIYCLLLFKNCGKQEKK